MTKRFQTQTAVSHCFQVAVAEKLCKVLKLAQRKRKFNEQTSTSLQVRGAAFRSGCASAASCWKAGLWSVTEGEINVLRQTHLVRGGWTGGRGESQKRPIAHRDGATRRRGRTSNAGPRQKESDSSWTFGSEQTLSFFLFCSFRFFLFF